MTQQQQLLKVGQVASILNISVSGVWSKVSKQAAFPKPIHLSAKQTRWVSSELDAFILTIMNTRPESQH